MVAKQMHKNQSEIAYTAWQDNSKSIIYHLSSSFSWTFIPLPAACLSTGSSGMRSQLKCNEMAWNRYQRTIITQTTLSESWRSCVAFSLFGLLAKSNFHVVEIKVAITRIEKMNKHFHTAWILFKSIMSDLSGRIVSADNGIVQKIGKWNIVPSWLHKSLVKSFFFLLLFYLSMFLFFCPSFIYGSELKMKLHCHIHKFDMKGWEVLSVKRKTLIWTYAENWISFSPSSHTFPRKWWRYILFFFKNS